jgi:hypothetical protein
MKNPIFYIKVCSNYFSNILFYISLIPNIFFIKGIILKNMELNPKRLICFRFERKVSFILNKIIEEEHYHEKEKVKIQIKAYRLFKIITHNIRRSNIVDFTDYSDISFGSGRRNNMDESESNHAGRLFADSHYLDHSSSCDRGGRSDADEFLKKHPDCGRIAGLAQADYHLVGDTERFRFHHGLRDPVFHGRQMDGIADFMRYISRPLVCSL